MNVEALRDAIGQALSEIRSPRYYETERGFQGQLLVELNRHLKVPNQALIEQEYQKRLSEHGLTTRPDIIIHEPFDSSVHESRTEKNLAVFELKRRASESDALSDLESLHSMLAVLKYQFAVFVNVDSDETYSWLLPDEGGQFLLYAVRLEAGRPVVRCAIR